MTESVDLILKAELSEAELLAQLNQLLDAGVESADVPRDGARLFLMHFNHERGFATTCSLCWGDPQLQVDDLALARQLAARLDSDVLLQPRNLELPLGLQWCLVDPQGALSAVEIIELEDGVEVRREPRLPLKA